MRSYVVGDIHGCLDELATLIEALPMELNDRLVFLGDYIDRGPDSKGVVSYLLELRQAGKQQIVFLKGNHEDMLLSFIGLPGLYGDMFLYNGGRATLTSYGISSPSASVEEVRARIPPAHFDFFTTLETYYVMGSFLCVHAGIHPGKPLEAQSEAELLWIRNEFIQNVHHLPYTVLFGHTPQRAVFFNLPYKIGLDTALVYGNKLTCLEVSERVLFQIDRGKKGVVRTPVKDEWFRVPQRDMA
jgi:serine/threonine protein phosphatase 1